MVKGLVSIVLSIYNVEKYLDRCIESVISQTYTDLEILLIDDGSPDSCPQKCDDWALRDNRIRVVHKKNAGLGMARNTGIEHANGEFIFFFDSDDYIDQTTVQKAYDLAQKEKAEIVLFGFSNVDANGKIVKQTVPSTPKCSYSDEEVTSFILPNLMGPNLETGEKCNLWISAWTSMYSMELINRSGWRFVSEREYISEDLYSLLALYKDVRRVAVLNQALYFYCENNASLTHAYRTDRFERNKVCYEACLSKCIENGYSEDVKQRLAYQYISNIIGTLKMIVSSNEKLNDKLKFIKGIVTDFDFQRVISNIPIKKETYARKLLLLVMRKRCWLATYIMVKTRG